MDFLLTHPSTTSFWRAVNKATCTFSIAFPSPLARFLVVIINFFAPTRPPVGVNYFCMDRKGLSVVANCTSQKKVKNMILFYFLLKSNLYILGCYRVQHLGMKCLKQNVFSNMCWGPENDCSSTPFGRSLLLLTSCFTFLLSVVWSHWLGLYLQKALQRSS